MLGRLQAIEGQVADPLDAMTNMVEQAMEFMDDYPSFARLWVSENWRAPGEWSAVFAELRGELLAVIGSAVDHVAGDYPVDQSIAREAWKRPSSVPSLWWDSTGKPTTRNAPAGKAWPP